MQSRIPAPVRKRPGAQMWGIAVVTMFCLLSATIAKANLMGTYNVSSSATGLVNINPAPGAGPFTVGGTGPTFCVDYIGCFGSGLSGSLSVTGTQVTFNFFGSTDSGNPGSFTINLTNFTTPITGVTLAFGALNYGTFGLSGFTANSISFTGNTGINSQSIDAIGGSTFTFNVTTTPEPSSGVLLLSILIPGLIIAAYRRMASSGGSMDQDGRRS